LAVVPPLVDQDALASAAIARAAAGELLGPTDMAAIWRIHKSRFSVLNRAGMFDAFKVKPAIGPKCFSGVLVHRYLQGEPVYEPTFGRKVRR
jgi:hypothetical protein